MLEVGDMELNVARRPPQGWVQQLLRCCVMEVDWERASTFQVAKGKRRNTGIE